MNRRTFCGVAALSLSAGCLQLQDASETAPDPDPVSSVDLEEAWSLDDRLRGVFARDGSFWGIADRRLLEVDTDGTIEWESERVTGDLPLTTFGSSDYDGRNVAVGDDVIAEGSRDPDAPVAAVYGFDPDTGELQWSDTLEPSTDRIRLEQVAYSDGIVVSILRIGSGNDIFSRLRAVESATGEFRWEETLDDTIAYYVTPVDGQLFVSTDEGLFTYEPETGERTGTIDLGVRRHHASSGSGTMCCATSAGLARIDLEAGEPLWTEDRQRTVTNLTADDTYVYSADEAGYVHAYDLETGTTQWEARLEAEWVLSGGFASSGDVLWACDTDGTLYGLAAANGETIYQEQLDEFGFDLATLDDRLVTSTDEPAYVIETDEVSDD